MSHSVSIRNDFEVSYRFLSAAEGGRASRPPIQGYRSDWTYADATANEIESNQAWMIWPIFLDENGDDLGMDEQAAVEGRARMYIVDVSLRETVHRRRIRVGTKGYFVEGSRVVAFAVVDRVVELAEEK